MIVSVILAELFKFLQVLWIDNGEKYAKHGKWNVPSFNGFQSVPRYFKKEQRKKERKREKSAWCMIAMYAAWMREISSTFLLW